ncbi:MAG: sodium:calcium antiporter, partial [Methylophilus sp.]
IRKGKDTLAFSNITGAMVFQGTLLPAIGIMLTPWLPRAEVVIGILFTLVAAIWLRVIATSQGGLRIWHLALNGILYVAYIAIVLNV